MSVDRSAGLRGRQPVKPSGERLAIDFLHRYLRSPLPVPRYPIDVSAGITDWHMLGNGPDPTLTLNGGRPVGDCTFAGRQHLRMAKAASAGTTETWESTDQLVTEYLAYNHGADKGANISEVLTYWFLAGKIRAFAPVDHSDPAGCDSVMAAFHGLYVGVDLTGSANSEFNAGQAWTLQSGNHPDPSDGHCIVKVKADGQEFDTWVTWGALQRSSRDWTATCIREAWAVVTTEDEAAKLDMAALLSDIVAAAKTPTAGAPPDSDRNVGATAFAMGWQMAQLYGPLAQSEPVCPSDQIPRITDHLPSIDEYDSSARRKLAVDELRSQLKRAGLHGLERRGLDEWHTKDLTTQRGTLRRLHYHILDTLACTDRALAACYQLGRALSDTCWLPAVAPQQADGIPPVQVLFDGFSRTRLASLQGWLGEMNSLAPHTVPAITRSLQNWSDWIDINRTPLTQGWTSHEPAVVAALREQGNIWHGLLSSENVDLGQPQIGAWIHAGEQILRAGRALAARMLRWYWPAAVVIVALTAGLLYLVIDNAHGAAKAWTSLVTVAGSVSVSVAGFRSGAKKLAGGLERTTWQAAGEDAQAWSITWLPNIHQKHLTLYRLRKRGVDPPASRH